MFVNQRPTNGYNKLIKISIIISMVGLAALGIIVYKDFENEA
jgi:hypothetical protein